MRLLDLHIDGFGKFHDRDIAFEDGINVIYGKNEAGKSTLHTFIRGMLFGIEKQRGRASKNDLYSKYEPWEQSGTYEGRLRVQCGGTVYRIERTFQKNRKELTVVNETLGREAEPTRALMDEICCGLSETAYNNTISIGQLKSATEAGMVTELKNYIANMNTTGDMSLNITKASAYLKNQRKELEAQMSPEAARAYASLLGEIKHVEKEIASPEYENQMKAYQSMRAQTKRLIDEKQAERAELMEKIAQGKKMLSDFQSTDQASIDAYREEIKKVCDDYSEAKRITGNKAASTFAALSLIAAAGLLAGAFYIYYFLRTSSLMTLSFGLVGAAAVLFILGAGLFARGRHYKKSLNLSSGMLTEVFTRHLGNGEISPEAMERFLKRMDEFSNLNATILRSEATAASQMEEISELQQKQNSCSEVIEEQQRTQWELEKKLEHLANCKNQIEGLKHLIEENDRIQEEIAAIDLAQETMAELSATIRDSFGLYLNKTASQLIKGITGGIYDSMSINENLNIFLNTKSKLVPLEQASSGTMDQVYLALRLAAARLIQGGEDNMPLIFDDSFVLYDEERLKTVLKWLSKTCRGQIIIFTCHQREAQMLTANQIPYNLINI